MNVIPVKNRVFIHRHPKETMQGGIILPEANPHDQQYGTVKAVGSAVEEIKVGDVVFFGKFVDIPYDDEHFFIQDKDILAVIYS